MPGHEQFELRRRSDALVYTFVRKLDLDGTTAYRRLDMDVWIRLRPDLGWVAWDEESQACTGGVWVSRKGSKSYVYDLVYISD